MKININTIVSNDNYGNKLQHYAVQTVLSEYADVVESTRFYYATNNIFIDNFKSFVKLIINKRYKNFKIFDNYINYSKNFIKNNVKFEKVIYDYYIVGSDQVWNATFGSFSKHNLLYDIPDSKRISFSASFGIDKLPDNYCELFRKELKRFKSISVREDCGKKIVEDLTQRKDVVVLIDPTMLLTCNQWDNISSIPKQIKKMKSSKYILNYFLGSLSETRMNEIKRIARQNDCFIINLLDKNDPFYCCGPSEFLYLEKHAFLICTDSFHSSVFAILYNRPFIVFDREQKGVASMNSRLETLLSKFNLKNRKFNGKTITNDNLQHNYSDAYKILEIERKKSTDFLKNALDIK